MVRWALNEARKEEVSRRVATIDEIVKLKDAVGEITDEMKDLAIDYLNNQSAQHQALMDYLNANHKSEMKFALKTNKLSEILKGAVESIKDVAYDELEACLPVIASQKTIIGANPNADVSDVCTKFALGNSALNFVQAGLLNLLAIKKSVSAFDELNLDGIYNPLTSPNIQTTSFPNGFNISSVEGLGNYFWYSQGELALPTLGYFFGGSRLDEKYVNKTFKAEDCSSAVAKWTGYNNPLSAWHFRTAVNDAECAKYPSDCAEVEEKFTQEQKARVGDVFVKGGHTGLINAIYDDGVMEVVSYNRDMPVKEGLGYNNITCNEEQACLFFSVKMEVVCEDIACNTFLE